MTTPRTIPGSDRATANRLLEAAAQVFSDRGFEHATVREVCRRAGANVAAVNYHFESKERLYLETIRSAMQLCHGSETADFLEFAARPGLSKEERLVGIVRRFALHLLGDHPEWHTRLIFQEMNRPTHATAMIVDEFLSPRFRAMREVMAPFLPGADDETLALHVMSLTGQVLYHRIATPFALRFLKRESYDAEFVTRIAEHIAGFTLAALGAGGSPAALSRLRPSRADLASARGPE